MGYLALYRRFRPKDFDEVKGQNHIITTLRNQVRVDRLSHAYLFCGTRGTGKTSVARILAKAVNCENPKDGNPCGKCEMCKEISAGTSMNVIEIDAASNSKVEMVRSVINEVRYSPTKGKKKVYIIDEVHMLKQEAFDALLKTLEEPPEYAIFILATTEVQKIPSTILSRCQRYDFHRISIETIKSSLRQVVDLDGIMVEERALGYIAKVADGSLRDSLSLLDECLAFNYGQEITYDRVIDVLGTVDTEVMQRLFLSLLTKNSVDAIKLISDVMLQGREMTQFINEFVWYLRSLMLVQASELIEDVVDASSETVQALKELSREVDIDTIMEFIRVFSELSSDLKYSTQKRVMVEVTIIKLCRTNDRSTDMAVTKKRIEALEERNKKTEQLINEIKKGSQSLAPIETGSSKVQIEKAKVLEAAVPDDIKNIVKDWTGILARMNNPMRTYMRNAKLSLDVENKLLIVMDNKLLAMKYSEGDSAIELQNSLDEAVGKRVDHVVRYIEPQKKFEENYIDLQAINFEVEIEEP